MSVTASRDLYLNKAKDKAVAAGPEAAFLLKRKGGEVPHGFEHLVTRGGNPRKPRTKEQKPQEDK
jgi:hypothetical protein